MKREVVTLYGRVQAVGYRERIVDIAREFRVAGSVRNLRTGQVEVDVEGEDASVDGFVDAIVQNRPQFAKVDGVNRRPQALRGAAGFRREATG